MASLSPEAAQNRVLHGGVTSLRNLFFKQRSFKHSNGVSFGLLPPRSSFPILKNSCNGILPVAAVGNGGGAWSISDETKILAKLVKERAYRFAGSSSTQIPDGAADEVDRLAMEAARRLAKLAADTFDRTNTQFAHNDAAAAASAVEFERFFDEQARRIAKEAAHMVERSVEEAANNTFAASETKEKRPEDKDPVSAVGNGGATWSCPNKTQRLAIEKLARLLKERAERFAVAGTNTQLPDDVADEIARLAMEAAETLFITSRDKFARMSTQFPDDNFMFIGADVDNAVELQRFLRKQAKRIAKEVEKMPAGSSTQLPDAAANEVETSAEEAANNTFSAGETKEKRSEDIDSENHAVSSDEKWSRYDEAKRLAIEAAERLAKETANMLAGDSKQLLDAAADEAERLAMEAAEKLVKDAADMFAGAGTQLQKLVDEAAKMLSPDDTKEKKSDDRVDNENNAASSVAGLIDEVSGLTKPYLTRVQDSYDVGDYIWTRIGTDKIEGEVISKDYNVTRLKVPYQRITVIDNHKLGWVDVLQK